MTITSTLPTHLVHSQTSKLSSKRQEGGLFASSHVKHLRRGNPVGNALIRSLSNALTSTGLASSFIASLTRENLAEREGEIGNLS